MKTEEHVGKTPNGGVSSIAYYLDEQYNPVDKEHATIIKIVEFDEGGIQIAETFMNKEQV